MKRASRVTRELLRKVTLLRLPWARTGDSETTETDIDTHSMDNRDTLRYLSLDQIKSVRLPRITCSDRSSDPSVRSSFTEAGRWTQFDDTHPIETLTVISLFLGSWPQMKQTFS
jgi:hypothetical protein